jgi:hypothetical protein
MALPSEEVLDHAGQPFRGAFDGFVHVRCMVCHCDRLATFNAGFHHATQGVVPALLVTVLVAQVDLHARDMLAEEAERTFHDAADEIGHRFVAVYVVIGVY